MTKHYRDLTGNYLGGFDGAEPPKGSIECTVPNHGLDKWLNGAWITPADVLDAQHNQTILSKMAAEEHRIVCAMCEKDPVYAALKKELK